MQVLKVTKYFLLNLLFVCMLLVLTGCASTAAILKTQQNLQTQTACQNSNLLYTDLTKPLDQRHYLLPDGRLCPEIN